MEKRLDYAKRLSIISLTTNLFLSAIKIISGLVGHSSVIIADGVDSLSDTITTLIAYMGVNIASKSADESHPYGHERFEAILSKILALFLFVVALGILNQARIEFTDPNRNMPTLFPLIAALISIVGKLFLSGYTMHYAKLMDSSIYMADGKNYLNDVLSSIGSLLGIYLARKGYPIFQPLFTLVIAGFLFKISLELYVESIADLSDVAAPPEVLEEIRKITFECDQCIESIDLLKSRRHGKRYYVDMEICLRGDMSLYDAHAIAHLVHDQIENQIPEVKHCMIHVNPC